MIDGTRVLAVVPARGGSKGFPRKNLAPLAGVPLVARVGDVVAQCPWIDRAVVSTDDEEIAAVARDAGLDAPFRRPADLSGDRVADVPVLQHALAATEQDDGTRYDVVVMLQPTAPMRTAAEVADAVRMLLDDDLDAVWTVTETAGHDHPVKQLRLTDGLLTFDHPDGGGFVSRQQLSRLWTRDGHAYVLRRATLEAGLLLGARTGALVTDGPLVDVDGPLDLEWAEFLLARRERGDAGAGSAHDDG